jgi:hypothetical protein
VTEYLVIFAATAKKELRDLPSDAIGRLIPRIRDLAGNPRPAGCKKLHGYKDRWRIRVGGAARHRRHRADQLSGHGLRFVSFGLGRASLSS